MNKKALIYYGAALMVLSAVYVYGEVRWRKDLKTLEEAEE